MKEYLSASSPPKDYLEESVFPLLDCLYKHKAKATFFITGKVVEKYPELIKRIHQEGHEISCHGFSHRNLNTFSPSELDKEIEKLIELIENITGRKPKGFRAPSFSLNNQTRWVLPILSKHELKYDSSVFPARTPFYGVANAPKDYIYRISFKDVSKIDPGSPLIEVPLAVYSFLGIRIPIAGGVYFRLLPLWLYKILLKGAISQQGTVNLYFHPHELYQETPIPRQGSWLRKKIKYFGVKDSFKKLDNLLSIFNFDSIENILKI
ncbi:MAG: hypothetical protein A3A08_00070 [Candidatus Nealsonbacteria bacterium RIFCSPLOWO2_01_FULL_41_9]|uniref:NodB homology domain-containing protein n=1 Tax=Candidatus Nealsonbacteria bacterium RIFCSPLOWO2_01_FULL_41_9 TaxID=1801671 RepID=A0A1G2EFN6_9BACT|nr:MAG: hypothetical protein A3A08_00070 [Candidatus Nealsonbacteria bacterium RIFCSPLOWO2_01_FULL_41_9]